MMLMPVLLLDDATEMMLCGEVVRDFVRKRADWNQNGQIHYKCILYLWQKKKKKKKKKTKKKTNKKKKKKNERSHIGFKS